MSIPKIPDSVKLISSILYSDQKVCEIAMDELSKKWGKIDFLEAGIPFRYTDYYYKEMGSPLFRNFLSFEMLIDRSKLIQAKLFSNQIENNLAKEGGARRLNIDPGYLTDSQVVLATGKNFSHRIYLGEGIFSDLTLLFKGKKYEALPWTYPDYQGEHMLSILMKIRNQYVEDRRGSHE